MSYHNYSFKTRLSGVFLATILLISPVVVSAGVLDDMAATLANASASLNNILTSLSSLSGTQQAQVAGTSGALSLAVTSPNGGESLAPGSTYTITWTSSSVIDKVSIGWSTGPGSLNWIATNIPNTNSYSWNVNVGNTTNTQFKIWMIGYQTGTGSVTDESDNFFTVGSSGGGVGAAPTITVIGTPTLALTYDSAGKEASLVANYIVQITAGSQALSFPSYAVSGGSWLPVSISLLNTAGQSGSVSVSTYGPTTIPAGTSATYNIRETANPNQLFAGAYTGTVNPVIYAGDPTNTSQTALSVSISGTTKTNSLMIIGERAPYISIVTSDASGNVTVSGARLNLYGNVFTIDGKAVIAGSTLTATSWSFNASSYGLASGSHLIQINNPQTGNSNTHYFTVSMTTQPPTIPTATITSSPTLGVGYDSLQKEATLTATFNIDVTAGSAGINLNKSQPPFAISLIDPKTNYAVNVNVGVNGSTYPSVKPVDYSPGGNLIDNGTYWTIPAGNKVSFIVSKIYNPKILFAGTYFARASFFADGGINILTPQNNSSYQATIIGEVSPYISGLTSDASGNVTVSGARLNLYGNVFTIDGKAVIAGSTLTATSWSFNASSYGLTSGSHLIQINNPQTGNSNTIYLMLNVGTVAPTITVLSPNGGETKALNSPLTVTWTSTNITSNERVSINLHGPYEGSAALLPLYNYSFGNVPNSGSFALNLPSTLSPGLYKLFISTTFPVGSPAQLASDWSDNYFTITSTTNSADMIPPSTPTALSATAITTSYSFPAVNLSWNSSTDNVGVVDYKIYRNGVLFATVNHSSVPTHSYKNDVGLSWGTTYSYTVAARDAAGNVSSMSATASITTAPSPSTLSLTVTSPNGGETLFVGDTKTITWSSSSVIDKVSIGWSTGPGSLNWIATNIPNTNSYSWNVNVGNTTNTQFKIDISGYQTGTGSVIDQSNNFFSVYSIANKTDLEIFKLCFGKSVIAGDSCAKADFNADNFIDFLDLGLLKSALKYDMNGDNIIDLRDATDNADLNFFKSCFGQYTTSSTSCVKADFDANGFINGADLALFKSAGAKNGVSYDINGDSRVDLRDSLTPDTIAPSTPINLSATAISTSQINLTWSPSTDNIGVVGYRVYRNGINITTTSTTSFSNTGLSAGTTHSYAVSAMDAAGNTSSQSGVANVTTQTTCPTSQTWNGSACVPTETTDILNLKAQIRSLLVNIENLRAQLKQCRGVNSTTSDLSVTDISDVQNVQNIVSTVSIITVDELQKHITLLLNIINRLNAQISTCQNTTTTPPVITPPVTQPPVIQPPVFTERNLYRGMRGEGVRKLQELLAKDPQIYPSGEATGYYGFLTQAAVQNFQCKYGIVCSGDPETTGYGVVGPKTMAKINEVAGSMSGGSTGSGGTASTPPISGNTVADLQAQIKSLMEQVNALTAKLNALPR